LGKVSCQFLAQLLPPDGSIWQWYNFKLLDAKMLANLTTTEGAE